MQWQCRCFDSDHEMSLRSDEEWEKTEERVEEFKAEMMAKPIDLREYFDDDAIDRMGDFERRHWRNMAENSLLMLTMGQSMTTAHALLCIFSAWQD